MMLTRWNPWRDLFDMEREASDLLRRAFGATSAPWLPQERGAWVPAVDMFTREGDLIVRAEVPGIDPERDLDITIQDGMLSIHGERRHEERTDEEGYYRVESNYGSFSRTVPLPEGVKTEDIRASYVDGVLEVVVPKAGELSAARKVPITVGGGRKVLTAKGKKRK